MKSRQYFTFPAGHQTGCVSPIHKFLRVDYRAPALITRAKGLVFHKKMSLEIPRSLWQMVRSPLSCLGPGLKSRLFADAPGFFHHLPEHLRLRTVQTFLGPAGGWFAKEKIAGKVPVLHEST